MAFNFEELKKMALDLGQTGLNMAQTGMDKGVQMAGVAKLKAANIKEESNLRALYVELGKLYFADHGAEPEEAYAPVCAQIADIQAAVAANNAKIAEMKIAPDAAVDVDVEEEVEVEAEAVAEEAPAEEAAPVEEAPAEEAAPVEEAPVEEASAEDDGEYGFTD